MEPRCVITEFRLPEIEDGVSKVTVVAWHRQPGDAVAVGDVLLEVMTEKVNIAVESTAAGTVTEILYPVDAEVAVNSVVARIEQRD